MNARAQRIGQGIVLGACITLGIAACTPPQIQLAETAAQLSLKGAIKLLNWYEGTPTPSLSVLQTAGQLLATAEAAVTAYEKTPTDANKAALSQAVTDLALYLATAAPGTPPTSTAPVVPAIVPPTVADSSTAPLITPPN